MSNNLRSSIIPSGMMEVDSTLVAFANEYDSSIAGILRAYILQDINITNNTDNDGLNTFYHDAGFVPQFAVFCKYDSTHAFRYCTINFDEFTMSTLTIRNSWKYSSFRVSILLLGLR